MREFEFVNDFIDNCIVDNGVIKNEYGIVKLPKRSTANSAGYDFFCPRDTICKAHEITIIPTGVKAKFPNDEVLLLFNRSSNPKKKGLIIPNGVGVIDAKAC